MVREGRFGIVKSLWRGLIFALVLGGGYNLVTGSRTAQTVVVSPAIDAGYREEEEESGLELATFMGHLQIMAHKLNLAIVAENAELSEFYLHEVEEALEQIEVLFPDHDGYPVGDMVTTFAMRSLDPVDAAVASGDWIFASQSYGHFVESCNACHGATGHPFIVIKTTSINPFNQDFGRELEFLRRAEAADVDPAGKVLKMKRVVLAIGSS